MPGLRNQTFALALFFLALRLLSLPEMRGPVSHDGQGIRHHVGRGMRPACLGGAGFAGRYILVCGR
jgi:hypothetical protein